MVRLDLDVMEWSAQVKNIFPHIHEPLRLMIYTRLKAATELHLSEHILNAIASVASAYPGVKAQAMTKAKVMPILQKTGANTIACTRVSTTETGGF